MIAALKTSIGNNCILEVLDTRHNVQQVVLLSNTLADSISKSKDYKRISHFWLVLFECNQWVAT